VSEYNERVRKNFGILKDIYRLDILFSKCISLDNDQGFLLPMCKLQATDKSLIEILSKWRNENSFAFFSHFKVTFSGTSNWLQSQIINRKDRILFLLIDKYGNRIGHLGFTNSINDKEEMEIDSVLCGVKRVDKGIMSNAIIALIKWAQETIMPRIIFLRVFSDNEKAIKFYKGVGFKIVEKIPLRKCVEHDRIVYESYEEDDDKEPDKFALRMIYVPNK